MSVEVIDALAVKDLTVDKLTLSGTVPDVSEATNSNGTANVTISNVAPSNVGTATISRWLKVIYDNNVYFIPMWT